MIVKQWLGSAILVLLITGCTSSPSGRYDIDDDIAPSTPISVDHIEDAIPKFEPYSLGGNKNYTLRGNDYQIVKQTSGYKERGQASWYGKKFHGHLTSNGEIYDMYSMSAAHKTLPLPSYVKVTNLDNNKTAIVRVNDRGPFHPGRIIDLSYAAAKKLGVLQTGTANVEIEVINTSKSTTKKPKSTVHNYVIQVASSKQLQPLRTLVANLGQNLSVSGFVSSEQNLHRGFLGPFHDYATTQDTLEKVKQLGHTSAFIRKQSTEQ